MLPLPRCDGIGKERLLSNRILAVLTLALAATAAGFGLTVAGDKDKKEQAYDPAMMVAWQKAMTPGDHHAHFNSWVGEWKTTMTIWSEPGAEPMVTQGKASFEFEVRRAVSRPKERGHRDGNAARGNRYQRL